MVERSLHYKQSIYLSYLPEYKGTIGQGRGKDDDVCQELGDIGIKHASFHIIEDDVCLKRSDAIYHQCSLLKNGHFHPMSGCDLES